MVNDASSGDGSGGNAATDSAPSRGPTGTRAGSVTDDADEPPLACSNHRADAVVGSKSQQQDHVASLQDAESPADGKKSPSESLDIDDVTATTTIVAVDTNDGVTAVVVVPWEGDPSVAHLYDVADIEKWLAVSVQNGLTSDEVKARLERDGPNKIDGAGSVSLGKILLRQVSNSLTIVLLIAMALSYGTLDFIEGGVISAVILLNIVLGFVQDFRAEKTMQSLLQLAAPSSQVVRNGGVIEVVKADSLVVGDIVRLTTGVVVPADLRLVESANLEVDEALLTGESLPSTKQSTTMTASPGADIPLGDRCNIAYSATTVTKGRAMGIVVATGMKTEVGTVAQLLRGKAVDDQNSPLWKRWLRRTKNGVKGILGLVGTPMQVKLSKFALLLFGLAILLAIIVFSANKWHLDNEVVLYGICVAVAVIPESLIAVMTITLAVGVKAMAKGHVVIRRMAALEAIGGVTNICSDKTGTLTMGKMVAEKVWVPDVGTMRIQGVTDILNPNEGVITVNDEQIRGQGGGSVKPFIPILSAVALCNVASVTSTIATTSEKPGGIWQAVGDPTEIALQVLAMRFARGKETMVQDEALHLVTEHQFDSTLKRMSMAYHRDGHDQIRVLVKGASESILPILTMSEKDKLALEPKLEGLASEGLRVLCIASKTVGMEDLDRLQDRAFMESGLNFEGLVGLHDPPRVESLGAVKRCHGAGIAVHMLTGDHLSTATAIGLAVGILKPHEKGTSMVMQAQDFDRMPDAAVDALPQLPKVLARCSPATKVRFVDAMYRRRAFCLMTGDGINDAPALKRAHVGIAMGINGTDVAKDAADMVLTDDNFASIVKAVEEGRRLFDNIQKFLLHLLISNIAQVILLLIALAFKDDDGNSVFPLSPLEILWVNMVTSSFLALGLGLEEAQADIMIRPPRDLRVGVFTRELITDKMLYGTWAGALCLAAFAAVVYGAGDGALGRDCNHGWTDDGGCAVVFRGRATVFATLSFILLVTAWEVKHFTRPIWDLDPARFGGSGSGEGWYSGVARLARALVYNRFLLWAVVAGFAITFPVVYIPIVNRAIFKHTAITWEWGVVVGCLAAYVVFIEAWKAVKRRFGLFAVDVPVGMKGEV